LQILRRAQGRGFTTRRPGCSSTRLVRRCVAVQPSHPQPTILFALRFHHHRTVRMSSRTRKEERRAGVSQSEQRTSSEIGSPPFYLVPPQDAPSCNVNVMSGDRVRLQSRWPPACRATGPGPKPPRHYINVSRYSTAVVDVHIRRIASHKIMAIASVGVSEAALLAAVSGIAEESNIQGPHTT
jgi:hypothetical protein